MRFTRGRVGAPIRVGGRSRADLGSIWGRYISNQFLRGYHRRPAMTRRTAEVGDLQREVRTLRGQLESALKDLTSANDRVTTALTAETSLRGRALEMLRREVADAIQLASEVHHLKTIQATHFGKLATELKTERHERQAGQQALDALLSSEVDSDSGVRVRRLPCNSEQGVLRRSQVAGRLGQTCPLMFRGVQRCCSSAQHARVLEMMCRPNLAEEISTHRPVTHRGKLSLKGCYQSQWAFAEKGTGEASARIGE